MYQVRGSSNRRSQPASLIRALNELRRAVHVCIAEYAQDRIFIHAGVAAWKGRGILLPGQTFAGKSTLTASMLKSGATYYSDEYAVIDNDGRIYPFPLPLHIREDGGSFVPVPVNQVGKRPLTPGLILFARYRSNKRWNPEPLTPGQAVLRLTRNSISMRKNPAAVLPLLKRIALLAPAYASDRGEAGEVVEWLETNCFNNLAATCIV